jgi:hypothetical protein
MTIEIDRDLFSPQRLFKYAVMSTMDWAVRPRLAGPQMTEHPHVGDVGGLNAFPQRPIQETE